MWREMVVRIVDTPLNWVKEEIGNDWDARKIAKNSFQDSYLTVSHSVSIPSNILTYPCLHIRILFETAAIVFNQILQQLWTKKLAQTNPTHNQPIDYFEMDSNPSRTHCPYDFVYFQLNRVVDLSSKFLSFHHSLPTLLDRHRVSNSEFYALQWSLKIFAKVALKNVECPRVLRVLLNH